MFTSTTKRAALALSGLILALSGQPLPAQTSHTLMPAGKPGEAQVTVGAEATVLSSAHYQARLILNCTVFECDGVFPAVATKRRLNLTRMNCIMQSLTGGSVYSIGVVRLETAANGLVLDEYLPLGSSSPVGAHMLNQEIDMQVVATRHIRVFLRLATGTVVSAFCTASGTLDTLQ